MQLSRLSPRLCILIGMTAVCTAIATSALRSSNVLAAAPPPAPASSRPAGVEKETFVLVHGAYAGGWEWKKCGELLASHGHTVYRPTLTGNGEREHLANTDIDTNTHIQDIVNVIRFEDLHNVVLVGHSYGGSVITGVVDRIPDRFKCVIYVDAGLPLDGETADQARTGNPPRVVDGYVGSAPRPDAKPPYTVKMSAKTFFTPLSLKNQAAAIKVPTEYILTVDAGRKAEDDMFYKCYQRAQERGWSTSIMTGDHVVHINQTAALVERLEKATLTAKAGTPPAAK